MFGTPEVELEGFDYLDATELDEMYRNLKLLYSTAAGTCPGDRSFGLDQSFVGYPFNVAQNLFALEVIEKTEIYETRAEVLDISFEESEDGRIEPVITIGRKEAEDGEEDGEAEDGEF